MGTHAVDHCEESAGYRQRSSCSDHDAVETRFTLRRFTRTTGITRPVTASMPLASNSVDVSTIRQHPLRDFIQCLPYQNPRTNSSRRFSDNSAGVQGCAGRVVTDETLRHSVALALCLPERRVLSCSGFEEYGLVRQQSPPASADRVPSPLSGKVSASHAAVCGASAYLITTSNESQQARLLVDEDFNSTEDRAVEHKLEFAPAW